ncbi:MAG: L,D-transpeptidase [Anaerolineaceae bacterium]
MSTLFSRRDFLKIGALSLASLAFKPIYNFGELMDGENLARVTIPSVSVYSQPDEESIIKFQRFRDEIFHIYSEVLSDKKPLTNPLWYKVWGGYIHSAHTQRVQAHLNPINETLSEGLHAAEITVPYSQSYLQRQKGKWTELYRLYCDSTHWVTQLVEGPDGLPWYRIKDEMLMLDSLDYYVPAQHVRLIPAEEMTPIAADVDPSRKRVEISLDKQELTAYEDSRIVLKTKISSGLDYFPPNEIPYNTPPGTFYVENKMLTKHMGGGDLSSDLEAYILPGVPWVSFFEPVLGVAFHGTFWHHNFGNKMSHGCVNMINDEAKWLYRWLTPAANPGQMSTTGRGSQVIVY